MAVKNRFAELHDEITAWRRDIHENPELLYDTNRTAALVAEKLGEFGCDDVVAGIGRTGVVGVIKGKTDKSGKVIGIASCLPSEGKSTICSNLGLLLGLCLFVVAAIWSAATRYLARTTSAIIVLSVAMHIVAPLMAPPGV